MGVGGAGLHCGGQGDAPGTGLQLPLKKPRHHAGLAVGRQLGATVADEALHPADVVFQGLAVQHQGRQADVLQQARALGSGTLFHPWQIKNGRHVALLIQRGCAQPQDSINR